MKNNTNNFLEQKKLSFNWQNIEPIIFNELKHKEECLIFIFFLNFFLLCLLSL